MTLTDTTVGSLLADDRWRGRVYTGEWRAATATIDLVAPGSGAALGEVGAARDDELDASVAAAVEAQRGWAAISFEERAAVLRRAGALWERHSAEVARWIQQETGAIAMKAGAEAHWVATELFDAAALPAAPLGRVLPSAERRFSFSRRVPVGVVGVISPFNFPVILAMRSVAPALALGNAVVLKPDPRTPVCGGVALARIFEEAGLPPGLLHVLPGGAELGAAIVEHPDIPVISFTGSTSGGRSVGEAAARHLKRAHLELGGNSALIVLGDADLDRAPLAGAFGSFLHQGQICMAIGRHLVHESVVEEYVERLAAKADSLTVGDPVADDVALGPIIDERQLGKVHEIVTATVAAGARVAAGATHTGLFYRPTVLAGVTPEMPAFRQEIFGPVAPVTSFSSLEEAVALARDTRYGLSLGILTADVMAGLELAGKIPTGIAHINDQTVGDESVAPFGGVGDSGTGSRFGGAEANIDAFTESQWVTMQARPQDYPL